MTESIVDDIFAQIIDMDEERAIIFRRIVATATIAATRYVTRVDADLLAKATREGQDAVDAYNVDRAAFLLDLFHASLRSNIHALEGGFE